jgi:hypothetical protein
MITGEPQTSRNHHHAGREDARAETAWSNLEGRKVPREVYGLTRRDEAMPSAVLNGGPGSVVPPPDDSVTLILPPVAARSPLKPAFEGACEARRVLISDGVGDFLDAHIAGCEQVRRPLHSLLEEHMTEGSARGLFEQVTKIGTAEMKSPGPVVDGASRVVFHLLQKPAETPILNRGWRTEGMHASLRKWVRV